MDWLSSAERERATRFHHDRDRERFLGRRVFVRLLLAGYLRRAPQELRFEAGPHCKPRLVDEPGGLAFSLSHSAGQALVAVSCGREVGIDLEAHASLAEPEERERVAQTILSTAELVEWAALPAAAREAAFFRLWTRKEALLKALGIGLGIEPSAIHVGLSERPPLEHHTAASEPLLTSFGALCDLPAPPGYSAALCAAGRDWRIETCNTVPGTFFRCPRD